MQDKVNDVSHTAAITTLNDPTVIETAQKFVNSTLTDNAVQEAAGIVPKFRNNHIHHET